MNDAFLSPTIYKRLPLIQRSLGKSIFVAIEESDTVDFLPFDEEGIDTAVDNIFLERDRPDARSILYNADIGTTLRGNRGTAIVVSGNVWGEENA